MPVISSAQYTRAVQFQSDYCALVEADFYNTNFPDWFDNYIKYVKYGIPSEDSRGADRPPHKPPTP